MALADLAVQGNNMDRRELHRYITDKIDKCQTSNEERAVLNELVREFALNPEKLSLLLMSGQDSSAAKKLISRIASISGRLPTAEEDIANQLSIHDAILDPEDFGTEAFPNDVSLMQEAMRERLYGSDRSTHNVILDPEEFGGSDFPPIATEEEMSAINNLYANDPNLNESDAWIQTYRGHKFYPQYPDKSVIDILDIAHALSNQCRFTGHTSQHYSVAQHCLLVSYLCKPENALQGLLHDASEAYLTDIATPIKRLPELVGYRELEKGVQRAIFKHFGVPEVETDDVKQADRLVLGIEAQTFLTELHPDWKMPVEPPPFLKIQTETPEEVEEFFLLRAYDLMGKK